MTSEKAPELKERLDMLSEGATPGPYGVESYGSGTTYITLGTWPGHYASDTVPPMGYGRAEIVTTNIPRAWGEVGRKGHTAHFLTELANAYRAGKLVTADAAQAMVAAAYEAAAKSADEQGLASARWVLAGLPKPIASEQCEIAAASIRALTPADASAALAERDNATWNAAIDAALGLRLTYLVDSKVNPTGKIVQRPAEDIARAIAALKREKPE